MFGLIKKDLKSMSQQGVAVFTLMVFFGLLSILGNQDMSSVFMGIVSMFSVLLPITAISYDEKAHWDRYALTMPVSRNMLVLSKYLLSVFVSILCGILTMAIGLISKAFPLNEALLMSWIMVGVALFLSAITYPLYFKLGVEKARYVFIATFMVPSILIMLVNYLNISLPSINEANLEAMLPLLPVAALALFGASAFLSCRIYAKKEF